MNTDLIIMGIAIAAVLVIAYWLISSGAYGRLSPSDEVTAFYKEFHADPDRNFYISGSADFPNAIIGLDKSLTLDTDLWKAIEATPGKMKDLVENMGIRAAERDQSLQGYDILDEKGRKVGSWFSLPGLDIMIRRSGEHQFSISTPPLEAWQRR